MAMLTLNGVVTNVFHKDASTDRKTGEVIQASDHIQVMAENILPNGEKRMELVTLKVENPAPYRSAIGKAVRVPVGVFASGNGVQFYALKGQAAAGAGGVASQP